MRSDSNNKELGLDINNGLIECFLDNILQVAYNRKALKSKYIIECNIIDILLNFIGMDKSIILFLTKQDVIINKLKTIDYDKTNLLDYLKKQLNEARIYNCLNENNLTTNEIINCCEALSDCKELIYIEKGKVYEKKFENNYR